MQVTEQSLGKQDRLGGDSNFSLRLTELKLLLIDIRVEMLAMWLQVERSSVFQAGG